MTIKTVYTSRF